MKIRLHGISEGKAEIHLTENANNIADLPEEFFGEISLNGTLTKYRNRFVLAGKVTCSANLICDLCAEEYIANINADMEINLIADIDMFFLQNEHKANDKDEIIVHPDDVYYDIAPDVKDFLSLNIPLRRRCTACHDKKFSDILPQFASKKTLYPKK